MNWSWRYWVKMPDGEKGINKNRFLDMGKRGSRNGRGQGTHMGWLYRFHLYQGLTPLDPGRSIQGPHSPEAAYCISLWGCVSAFFFWREDSWVSSGPQNGPKTVAELVLTSWVLHRKFLFYLLDKSAILEHIRNKLLKLYLLQNLGTMKVILLSSCQK